MEFWTIENEDGDTSFIYDEEFTMTNATITLLIYGYPYLMIGYWLYNIFQNIWVAIIGGFISLIIAFILFARGCYIALVLLYIGTLIPLIMMIYNWFY